MKKNRQKYYSLYVAYALLTLAIVIGLSTLNVKQSIQTSWPGSEQAHEIEKAGFKYYYPTYLPSGVSIVNKILDVNSYYSGGDPEGEIVTNTNLTLGFRKVDNVYSIIERHFDPDIVSESEFIAVTSDNYDTTSQEPSCTQRLVGSQKYRLCHWYDYGKLYSVYELKFVKGSTSIYVKLNSPHGRTLQDSEIAQFVGSFKVADPRDLTLQRSFGSG